MDGLLLFAGDNASRNFMKSLATLELLCVAIDREVPDVPSVRVDHRGGGLEVTRYLIGLGHRYPDDVSIVCTAGLLIGRL